MQRFSSFPEPGKCERRHLGLVTCAVSPGLCEDLPCSAPVTAPHQGQGRLQHQSHIPDNPSITGDGHFTPELLLLSILTGVKHTEHPQQATASGGQQGPSRGTASLSHPSQRRTPPSIQDIAPERQKKSWQGARGWLCPRAAAVSCGSNASHTFKGTPSQLMDVSQPTVCVLTQPLCQGKTTASVCGCVCIQRL